MYTCNNLTLPPKQLSTAEQNLIVSAFADPEQQQAIGVTLAGEKFFVLQATEEHIYGKNAVRSFAALTRDF